LPVGYHPPHHTDESQAKQTTMGIWWPAADSAKLRSAARAWREMALAIDSVDASTQSAVLNVLADNQGAAMAGFDTHWQKWSAGNGYLPTCSHACTAMAKALDEYAQAVDTARVKVEQLVAEIGTAVVLGVVLGVCTVGIATAAAAGVSAALIASAELVGIALTETASMIIGGVLVGVTFGAVEAMAIDIVAIQPEKILLFHDQKDFSWGEVLQWGEMGAAGGLVGGALGAGLGAGADALPATVSAAMATRLGRVAMGGVAGAGTSAILDEIQYGQINPLDVAAGTVGGAAGAGVGSRPKVVDSRTGYRYNMIEDNGPLATMRGNPAQQFAGGHYNVFVTTEKIIVYRGGPAGGGDNAYGRWFSLEPSLSRAQIRIELAVKPEWLDPVTGERAGSSPIESLYALEVPAGTTIYVGPASNQGGVHMGGRIQVFIPEPRNLKVLSETPLP
jgi:hypothetical protein